MLHFPKPAVQRILVAFFTGFLCLSLYAQNHTKTLLFIGTYTDGKPDAGIYIYEFNPKTGELLKQSNGQNIINPSFLSVSPDGRYLYACTETKLPIPGSISAFKIDSVGSKIAFINKQETGGENPAHVNVSANNKFVVGGNYTGGSVAVFQTNPDGSLNPYTQHIQFTDSSIIKSRQEKSHIHAAIFSPDNQYLYLPDLGSDKIRAFKFSNGEKPLSETNFTVKCVSGSGPRHFTFHPNKKFAYCIEELSGTVSVYRYQNGKLDSIQRIASYAKKLDIYSGADIHVSPDGRFLYVSNRIENTIAIFAINTSTGKLTLKGHQPTLGDHPRNFMIDPTGNFVLVANLNTNNIIVFKRNVKTGLLAKTPYEISIPRPSCLKMRIYGK
jgi:6-phosphogluconolactonase (cycloisomerase 2 family)